MTYAILSSDVTAIDTAVSIDVDPELAHSFAGIIFYDAMDAEVAITAGTVTISAKHLTNNKLETVVDGVLTSASQNSEGQWSGNVTEVRATPQNLAGNAVATYQLVVVQNRT